MDSDDSSGDEQSMKIDHRHSDHHIQLLEEYFKDCPYPNDFQRVKLGEELNLKPAQIKFWFQNKRTKVQVQTDRGNNTILKADNVKLKLENEAIEEGLKTVLCPPCGGPNFGPVERELRLKELRMENVLLKQQYEELSRERARENIKKLQPPLQHFPPLSPMEKMKMIETARQAVAEVLRIIRVTEPMWIKSANGGLMIHEATYDAFFGNSSHIKNPSARVESSKEVVMVPMEAKSLIQMFLNTEEWAMLFPTVVKEAKTVHELESVDSQGANQSKLMYEQLHILSPLVLPREFMVLRSCKQVEENICVIADVSYNLPYVDFEFGPPTCSRRPSGCLIEALPNGFAKVTWMEHVEVDNRETMHQLYRELLCGNSGFGARRWAVSLERMCERLSLSSISVNPTTDYYGGVATIEGKRTITALGERMLRDFAWILKRSKKLDFSELSEASDNAVRVSVRTNTKPGQPPTLILSACSSLCLPIPPLQVFNFLTNLDVRHQWEVLCHGNPVSEAVRFATGADQRNCVTILRPSAITETRELMIIQDVFIDALGGMVVYAPIDLDTAGAAFSGQLDPSNVLILPSGFIISPDGSPLGADLTTGSDHCMTLLTVGFQLLLPGPSYSESAATVHTLLTSTVQRIKAMLNCNDAH